MIIYGVLWKKTVSITGTEAAPQDSWTPMIVIAMGEARPEVKIDFVGMLLAAVSIFLINLGFNNVRTWGVLLAGACGTVQHSRPAAGGNTRWR